ncbi:MAG TPA: extracellular solute-binding protein, partial [Chloroflexota bacterium]|nr:extracellular solute-binding protein [Chloroflexota bacterium]
MSAATAVVPKAGTVNFYAYVSNPAETGQWNGYAKKYMATHPGTQVAVSGTGGDYWTKLQTMMASGAPPDVVQLYSLVFSPFAAKDTLLDLSPYIARDKYDLGDFYPVSYEAFQWKGAKLGLSTDLYLVGFYYAPDLFAAAGVKEPDSTWTWQNVREAAQRLTKPDKSQFGIRLANDYSRWATVAWDYGAHFFERQDDPRKASFDQQPVIDGVSQWVDMINKDHSSPTDAELA